MEETMITGNSAQVSLNEEAQATTSNLVESSPAVVEKQRGAPDPAKGCSSEEEVQNKKLEEMTFRNEAGGVKAESVKDDKPSVDNEKQVHPETKVKQSLLKAKKSITGKSPTTSKTISQAKDYIKFNKLCLRAMGCAVGGINHLRNAKDTLFITLL
ncbi:hypothetical protein TSUD_343880 [Trifolium subterraneum]|nr:hypothetical protein TSUD_343880 [Trifolium subterraneum]